MIFIIIGVFIGIVVLLTILLKSLRKAIFISNILFIVLGLTIGVLIVKDINDFREKFFVETKIFLLENKNNIVAGIALTSLDENFKPLNNIKELNYYYKNKRFNKLLDNGWKIFIINTDVFTNLDKDINIDGLTFKKRALLRILTFHTLEELKKYLNLPLNLEMNLTEIKVMSFSLLMKDEFEERPLFLLEEYKNKNVIIYPKTPMLLALDLLPNWFTKKIITQYGGEIK